MVLNQGNKGDIKYFSMPTSSFWKYFAIWKIFHYLPLAWEWHQMVWQKFVKEACFHKNQSCCLWKPGLIVKINTYISNLFSSTTLSAELRICWLYPLQRGKILSKKGCPESDIKLYLMVRLQFWGFRKCGVPLHYHHSQVHGDLEC